jgi:hypothetical protein
MYAPFAMRVVIRLPSAYRVERRGCSSTVEIDLYTEDANGDGQGQCRTPQLLRAFQADNAQVPRGGIVSLFFGGPDDERFRRDIPEGEHIVEDPIFDPIGFYGLEGIDRGRGSVVQWYRWISNDEAESLG